jgi:hypothetical protein
LGSTKETAGKGPTPGTPWACARNRGSGLK